MTATATPTPKWLVQPEMRLCPCGCIGKRRKGSFVEKTINGGANVMRQAMFAEDVAGERGLLQRVDPRVKIATLFGLLVVTAFVRHIPVLVALYFITLVLAVASKVPLSFFVKRVWLFIPIFTGIVVLPATLSVITPGTIVVPLTHGIGITAQGLESAGLIVTRVATSISIVVLLTLTTPWDRVVAGLRGLRVPRMFVTVLAMAYRYVFLLLGSITDMYIARKARTVTREKHNAGSRAFVAASAGALFGKAHGLSDEVHMAMVARGFTGDARTLTAMRVRQFDVIFIGGTVLAAALVLGADRAIGL